MPQPETLRINFVTGAVRRYIPHIEALAAVPDRVEWVLHGQPPGWNTQSPREGEWSPSRVVGHLIAYAEQQHENLYRMANMTDPIIKVTDDEGEAERNSWESQPPSQLLESLREQVAKNVELLSDLPDSSWGRPGQHPEDGRRSIRQQAVRMAEHFEEHIAQIEAMRQ
jgi:hypothetical protein